VYRSKLLGFLGAIVLLTASSGATPQDGDAAVHIGPIRWTKDSIGAFAAPDAANVLFLANKPDSAILVVDPNTGVERQRLRGYVQDQSSFMCSPDGMLCLMGGGSIDGRTLTLLYSSEGQLLREWNESSEAWAISAKLQRACVLMKDGDVAGCALRDLTTGETIKWLDGWEYVWFDEWHNRLYVGTGKWGGEFGNWTVELDATTGQELNKWRLETYGPMCRLKDSDTLLVVGEDMQKPGLRLAKVVALNIATGGRGPIIQCPADVSDKCSCFKINIYHWSLNRDGGNAILQRIRGLNDRSVIARRFHHGQLDNAECYLNDQLALTTGAPYVADDVNQNLYYLPNSYWGSFICRAIGPTLPVPEPGAPTSLMMVVDGSTLRITTPSDATGDGILSITDISGRLMQRSTVVLGGRPVSVSIAGLPTGSYLCSLQAGSISATGKFSVIQ